MIRRDLKELRISENEWYEEAKSRPGWRAMCRLGMVRDQTITEVKTNSNKGRRVWKEGEKVIKKTQVCG